MSRLPAAVLAGVAAAVAAAQPAPPPRPDDPAALRADPKADPAPPALAGLWVADLSDPGGAVKRYLALRILDADTAVLTTAQLSPGVRANGTVRGRYELVGDEFRLHVAERWAGVDQVRVGPADAKAPRVYRFAWTGPDKTGFTLTVPGAGGDPPWRAAEFKRSADRPAADPLAPKALRAVDRTLAKEPRYTSTPLYLLLAVGPDSQDRVWVVVDGTVLYVDANGNGDLTEPGERHPAARTGDADPDPKTPAFHVPRVATPGGTHTDFFLSVIRQGGACAKLGMKVNGTTLQVAGPANLRLTERPADARVLAFGSRVVTVRPSDTMPATPVVGAPVDYRVRVGTPGVGEGSFVGYGSEDVPDGVHPVAEFVFPGDRERRVTVPLERRCCGDQFYAAVTAPAGSTPGVDAAEIRLAFPNCPWGVVAPTVTRIDVAPPAR